MNIHITLLKKIKKTLTLLDINDFNKLNVRQSSKEEFGDYQIDGIVNIAKKINMSPFKLAEKINKKLNLKCIASKTSITGNGFINIFLNSKWIAKKLTYKFNIYQLKIKKNEKKNIIIDYSSPNIAKEMHIGHMRSTILGDTLARILKFLGHNVIKINHIGDWGAQFAITIAYLIKYKNLKFKFKDLENLYSLAKLKYDKDLDFAQYANKCLIDLQNKNKYIINVWKQIVHYSIKNNQRIYNKLNVTLKIKDVMGESSYNDMLPNIINDLKKKGLAVQNNGAWVVFLDKFKNREMQKMGVIIQKKGGAFLYTTIDIACIKYRCEILKANRIIYYTDVRQKQHLEQVWDIARQAQYIPQSVLLEHHMFGMILNKNNKPFKTRSGNNIKLIDLLNKIIDYSRHWIHKKNPNISLDELKKISNIVGIGALKYNDLSKNRINNYVFDWNKMLNIEGNTSLYIQYAYIRIISIIKNSNKNIKDINNNIIILETKQEIKLGIHILKLKETILTVANNGMPHILCSYLYHLSVLFSVFYEKCPILNLKNDLLFKSRLKLIFITSRIIKTGLSLLGIKILNYI